MRRNESGTPIDVEPYLQDLQEYLESVEGLIAASAIAVPQLRLLNPLEERGPGTVDPHQTDIAAREEAPHLPGRVLIAHNLAGFQPDFRRRVAGAYARMSKDHVLHQLSISAPCNAASAVLRPTA